MNRATGMAALLMMLGTASISMAQTAPKTTKPAPAGPAKLTDAVGSVNGKAVTWQMLFDRMRADAKAQQAAMAAQMPGQTVPDPIGQAVGQVIGDKVSKGVFGGTGSVTLTQSEILAEFKKNPPPALTGPLQIMLRDMVLEQEAAKAGIKVNDEFLDAFIARLLKQARSRGQVDAKMTDDEFLASRQIKRADLRRNVRWQAIGMTLAQRDAEKQQGHPYSGADFVHARHILIAVKQLGPEAKAEEKLKAEQEALDKIKTIAADIKTNKKDFAAVAKELSEDPSAKQNSGDLGVFGHGQMVPEFEKAAFSMKTGEISEPIKTQFGYHLILVEKSGSDLKPEEWQPSVDNALQQKFQQYLQDLTNDKSKVINNLRPQTAGMPMGMVPGRNVPRPNNPRQ